MKYLYFTLITLVCLIQFTNSQWVQHTGIPITSSVTDIEVYDEDSLDYMYISTKTGSIYRSTNCGMNWTLLTTAFPANTVIYDILIKDSVIYAAGTGVYKSINLGINWVSLSAGITDTVTSLFTYQGKLYAITNGSGIFYRKDIDTSWTMWTLNGIPANSTITAFETRGKYIYITVAGYGIYRSDDKGSTWTAVNTGLPANSNVTSMLTWGNRIYAAVSNVGIFMTMNNGNSWTMTDSIVATGNKFSDLTKIGSYLFFGSSGAPNAPGRGLYVSQNRGEEWYLMNDSFTVSAAYNITAIAACDSTLFVGTDGAGLWYRPLNEAITSDIAPFNDYVARLENNFPNPFNPTTNISFMIPRLNNVRLVVYDILGKEVATLVNSQLQPGSYDVVFDASKLASGIYYYSLITDDFTDTKRMVLVK